MNMSTPANLSGPHLVEMLLRHGDQSLCEIIVLRGGSARGLSRLVQLAESKQTPVRWVDAEEMERLAGQPAAEVLALVPERAPVSIENAVSAPPSKALVLALEGVEDPHNLGMILRTAHAAGADAAILEEHARSMSRETVARSSAGASECLPLIFIDDLATALDELAAKSIEAIAATPDGGENLFAAKLPARIALVVGGERRGLSRKAEAACRRRVTIPTSADIQSLPAAASAAVLLFEMVRRRKP